MGLPYCSRVFSLLAAMNFTAGCASGPNVASHRAGHSGVGTTDRKSDASTAATSGVKRVPDEKAKGKCFGILNGKPSEKYDFILKMTSPNVCTMSLLSPTTLLTAAHCVPKGLTTVTIAGIGPRAVAQVLTRGLYAEDAAEILSDKSNISRDLALLQLAEPLLDHSTVKIASEQPSVGDPVVVAGFGLMNTEEMGGLLVPSGNPSSTLLVAPNVLFGDVESALFVTLDKGDSIHGMTLPGDSGGPLLWHGQVIGTTHKGSLNFGLGGLSALVPTNADLLDRLKQHPPQALGVWVNLLETDTRAFFQEAKDAGFLWESSDPVDGSRAPEEMGAAASDEQLAPTAGPAVESSLPCKADDQAAGAAGSDTSGADSPAPPKAKDPDTATVEAYVAKMNFVRSHEANCGTADVPVLMPAVSALEWNSLLYQAALRHSTDLEAHGMAGHKGSDGSMPNNRVDDTGYKYFSVGENQATGFPDLNSVFDAWMKSPGHCTNNMADYYSEFGLAEVHGYWTLVFGRPR